MAHEPDKRNPWHERSIDVVGYQIGASSAPKNRPNAAIEIKQSDQEEQSDSNDEEVLQPWFLVRKTFKQSSQRVGNNKGEQLFELIHRGAGQLTGIDER